MTILTDGVHLMTDGDIDELHRFAQAMGLKRAWFQDKPLHPHYDLTTKHARKRAISAGAELVTARELAMRCSKLFSLRCTCGYGNYLSPAHEAYCPMRIGK